MTGSPRCGSPEHLADATTALAKIKTALQTGLVDPTEFEATRTRRVTELLGHLDAVSSRLWLVADTVDLDAPFNALDLVSPQGFEQFVAAHLALAHARILRMQPSGARPKWRPAALGYPGHDLRGPSSFVADGWPAFVPSTSGALVRARTVKLANGMTAILMPTSPIPIIDIRLVFDVGAADEPDAHRGTASLAVSAIDEMAARIHPDTRWAVGTHMSGAGLDSCGVALRGPALDSDLLLGQFDGLAGGTFQAVDILRAHRQRMLATQHPGLAAGWVFPTEKGTLHKGSPLRKVLDAACKACGTKHRVTCHGLRHTANDLLRRVADGEVVRAIIGHSTVAMTHHYSHVDEGEKRTAACRVLETVLGGISPRKEGIEEGTPGISPPVSVSAPSQAC